jgi:hypothetical protein
MTRTIIHNTDKFRVDSFGNGLCYELTLHGRPELPSLFFQGDDASMFRQEVEAGEKAGWSYNSIFQNIWGRTIF